MRLAHVLSHADQDVADHHLDDVAMRRPFWIIVDGQGNERRRGPVFLWRGQKTTPKTTAPIIDLPAGRPISARDIGDNGVGSQTLDGDPRPFRVRAPPPTRPTGKHLDPSRVACLWDVQLAVHFDVSIHEPPWKTRRILRTIRQLAAVGGGGEALTVWRAWFHS